MNEQRTDAHKHSHSPSHAPANFGAAFAVGVGLNTSFVLLEAIYGLWSGSVALLADAGHNASDVLGLLAAWCAIVLSKARPTHRFTYGLKGSSVLAALTNGVLLLVATGAILLEGAQRLARPQPVSGSGIMIVAAIGIVVNGITAWLFARGRKGDLNIRAAYLHMMADAAIAASVIVAGGLILLTGKYWIDPLASIGVALVVLAGTYRLLKESVAMSLDAVPARLDVRDVEHELARLEGVSAVHDIHVWSISTTDCALTAHLFMPGARPDDSFLRNAAKRMSDEFNIGHSTFQIETEAEEHCDLYRQDSA